MPQLDKRNALDPKFTEDAVALGKVVSVLGKTMLGAPRGNAEQNDITLEGLPVDPEADVPPEQILTVMRSFLATFFPLLAPSAS